MMNLDELRKLVDFMKENGLCELEYSEKHTSVKVRLAPPAMSPFGHHGPRPMHKDEPVEADYDLTDDEDGGLDIDIDELKASAKKAAKKAAHKAADGVETVASYVKSKLAEDESEAPAAEDDEDEVFESFSEDDEAPAEEAVKAEESSRLNRETLRHAREAVRNTVKAGAVLGKAGAKRGKERLVNLFRSDVPDGEEGPDDFELPAEEENDKE